MKKNELKFIRTGDIVLVKDYPNLQFKEAKTDPTKTRFAVVIGNFREGAVALPAQAISTRRGKALNPSYRIKENELMVPKEVINRQIDIEIRGVIKAHRFPLIEGKQMILKVGSLPLETKIQLIGIHEHIKNRPFQVQEMKMENPNYAKIMGFFKEVTVAEKLQFMRDNRGNHQYEFLRNKKFSLKAIQFLEKRKNLNLFSVKLEGNGKEFTHTFATRKSIKEIQKDWKKPKMAKAWIREDMKFHALQRNPLLELKPDPQPHPDKYTSLESLGKIQDQRINREKER